MLLLLIRHAETDAVGVRLAGRAPGHNLNAAGRSAAERLGTALSPLPLAAVYASPRERAQQTAAAVALAHRLTVHTLEAIDELDFGEWTERSFAELEDDPSWHRWNASRGTARIPGGETMLEVQQRVVNALERVAAAHAGETIAAVSHADVIRAALTLWLGIPLDELLQVEVAPASVHAVRFEGEARRVLPVSSPHPRETPARP